MTDAFVTNSVAYVTGQPAPLTQDTEGRLRTSGRTDHSTTGIGHGVTNVTTAGTDVALAASTAAKWVTIQGRRSNTANIAIGAAGVDATASTGTGVTLAAGETITIPCDNLADIYIDATVNGEGVRYTYGT